MSNHVSDKAILGEGVKIGIGSIVEEGAEIGDNVTIGNYCVIKSGAVIGAGTLMMDFVEIRKGTIIGPDCYVDSRVSTSGDCKVGRNVSLRYGTIIARGCDIGDDCYLSPRVMTNNLDQGKQSIGGAKIGNGCFIGTQAVLQHGITLADETIVGAMAFVTKSFSEKVTLVGVPAKPKE
ncbi:DapH/DapD/GlmU-related protein [Halomonas alimentaria]|uniref:UDP-3-O-(3-hydroxymyristoyl)glucosamine N-acyltransferase n=1 Tax=Halomonas alimentaria TaxID=147248 RepID=A0A7X4W2X8_9GAMM|nr:DapH/DapD/GlmU-related protein [Halomonas alimentaria]NAW33255.1 hypothetical protein [Halomonas alimentaria]